MKRDTDYTARWRDLHARFQAAKLAKPDQGLRGFALRIGVAPSTMWKIVHQYAPRGFARGTWQRSKRRTSA